MGFRAPLPCRPRHPARRPGPRRHDRSHGEDTQDLHADNQPERPPHPRRVIPRAGSAAPGPRGRFAGWPSAGAAPGGNVEGRGPSGLGWSYRCSQPKQRRIGGTTSISASKRRLSLTVAVAGRTASGMPERRAPLKSAAGTPISLGRSACPLPETSREAIGSAATAPLGAFRCRTPQDCETASCCLSSSAIDVSRWRAIEALASHPRRLTDAR